MPSMYADMQMAIERRDGDIKRLLLQKQKIEDWALRLITFTESAIGGESPSDRWCLEKLEEEGREIGVLK